MRRSLVVLGLLSPTAALLLLHFHLQTRGRDAAPAAPAVSAAILSGEPLRRVQETCRGRLLLDPMRLDLQPLDRAGFEVVSPGGPRFCQIHGDAAGPLAKIACGPLPEALQGMAQVGAEAGGPFLAGLDGVYGLDGAQAAATAQGRASGDRVYLLEGGAAVKLRDALGGQAPGAVWQKGASRREVDAPSSAFLVAGHLLWIAGEKLVARRLLREEPGFGPEAAVGDAPGFLTGSLRACRHRGGWEVAVPEPREAGALIRLFAVGAGGWSRRGEVPGDGVRGESWSLSCSEDGPQVGWVTGQGEVRVASCAAGPCDARSAAVASLGAAWAEPGGGPLAVPLGSQVAVVASRGRGVEVRVAALEQIAGAPPQRLLEEPVEMAAAETLSRGASALLLLRPRGAHHAYPIRLSTNGIRALACEGSPERTP